MRSEAGKAHDLHARMFTGRMVEDPATGSATAAVTARRSPRQQGPYSTLIHIPARTGLIHKGVSPRRPDSYFASTSCNIARSRLRSATSLFSLPFLPKREVAQTALRFRWFAAGLLELPQPFHPRRHQTGILLPPVVERRLADGRLAAQLADGRPILRLPQNERDLRLREPRRLDAASPLQTQS